MTAALPMGGQKITGLADPTVATDGATKNYVDTTTAAFFSTGDGKLTLKTSADSGWLLCDDGTFGSASSGASNRANADTLALFTLIFNNISDANAPILTSGGGATTRAAQVSASAAWAANCRMSLTKVLGRSIIIAGSGAGLTARTLGQNLGEESHTLSLTELPTGITSSGSTSNAISVVSTTSDVIHSAGMTTAGGQGGGTFTAAAIGFGIPTPSTVASTNPSQAISASVTSNNTSGATHNNMQPSSAWNIMVKL